jgi:hypothetical protein
MAYAFDNQNFIPGKQQILHSVVPPSVRTDIKNNPWEISSSPRSNHLPPSYEESVPNKALGNPKSSSFNDSSYRQRQQPATSNRK